MRSGISFAHLFQCGLGHSANALFCKRVEYFNEATSASPNFFAPNAHGIELMVIDKLCNLAHVGFLFRALGSLTPIQGQIKGIKISPLSL